MADGDAPLPPPSLLPPAEAPAEVTPEQVEAAEEEGGELAGVLATLRSVPRAVHLLLVGVALNRAASFVNLFIVLYLAEQGFEPERAGIALSGYGVGAVLGIVISGTVTDLLGYRATIIASMAISGLLVGSISVLDSFPALVAVTAGTGFAAQAYRPAAAAMMAALVPPRRLVMASAAFRLAINIGAAIGPLVGAAIIATAGYRELFVVDMFTSVGFALIALFGLPGKVRRTADDPARIGYRDVLADRRFRLVLAALFLIAVVDIQYLSTLPLSVKADGLSTQVYGLVVTLNAAFVILFELPITKVVQRFPIRAAIATGIALVGSGVAMFGLPFGVASLVVATLVWSFGESVAAPSAVAYPALIAPEAARGRYTASGVAAQSIGFAVGPAFGTFLWARSSGAAWVTFAVLGVIAAAFAWAGVDPSASSRRGAD